MGRRRARRRWTKKRVRECIREVAGSGLSGWDLIKAFEKCIEEERR